MKTVDWEEQWALFAENFYEGHAHIHLDPFGMDKTLKLKAGPGFGDLSHPTTALMLELMKGCVTGETLVDIGSGSGILSLAGALLGAKRAYGIDIDADAIVHSKENARLNGLEKKALFSLELPKIDTKAICLMNMIFPEQRQFGPDRLNSIAKRWITSGILAEQKDSYLEQTKAWGWHLVELRQKDQWLGATFTTYTGIF